MFMKSRISLLCRINIGLQLENNEALLMSQRTLKGLSCQLSEAAAHRCSSKQVFLKISQNPQQNTCVGVYF